jgi:hypothetical protein
LGGVPDLGLPVRHLSGQAAGKIRYGLIHPKSSDVNPFVIAYEDFWRLLKEVWNAPSWSARLRHAVP